MISEKDYFLTGKINEECGCFGVYNVENAASLTYFGLHALQHRGQEACGIAASDDTRIECVKNKGLISIRILSMRWVVRMRLVMCVIRLQEAMSLKMFNPLLLEHTKANFVLFIMVKL